MSCAELERAETADFEPLAASAALTDGQASSATVAAAAERQTRRKVRRRQDGAEINENSLDNDDEPRGARVQAAEQQQESPASMGQQMQRPASVAPSLARANYKQESCSKENSSAQARSPRRTGKLRPISRLADSLETTHQHQNVQQRTKSTSKQSSNQDLSSQSQSVGLVLQPQRPQSALAGSSSANSSLMITSQQQQRAKTTRVRINSTSEQIQDPNWLIQMSMELESSGSTLKTKSHLKNLHRKLKLNLLKSSSSSSNHSSSGGTSNQNQSTSVDSPGGNPDSPLMAVCNNQPNPLERQSIKKPVSILKQRSATNSPVLAEPSTARGKSPTATRSGKAKRAAQAGQHAQQPTSLVPSNNSSQQQQQQQSHQSSQQQPVVVSAATTTKQAGQASKDKSPSSAVANSISGTDDAPISAKTISRPVPICADGQVKVSGWKRNNLLAKTLSHFDEIRGNQRPVFVPTKITVPADVPRSMSPRQAAAIAGNNKFAEIVREALLKKSQLIASKAGEDSSERPASACEANFGHARQEHRSSSSAGFSSSSSPTQRVSPLASPPAGQSASPKHAKQQVFPASSPVSKAHLFSSHLLQISDYSQSTRQFKLQQKNNQVLQNLRRQSNELQASLQQQQQDENSPNAPGQTARAGSMHLKDWKRLTGKLALLTSSRASSAAKEGQLSVQQMPLRLTVSNQESSTLTLSGPTGASSVALGRANTQRRAKQHQPTVLQVPGGGDPSASASQEPFARKLSSSSMIVQANSAKTSGQAHLNAHLDFGGQRRRSDSEAYQLITASSEARDATMLPEVASTTSVVAAAAEASSNEQAAPPPLAVKPPVVVHRDDLIQLLQVTETSLPASKRNSCTSNDSAASQLGGNRQKASRHNSLQLDDYEPAALAGSLSRRAGSISKSSSVDENLAGSQSNSNQGDEEADSNAKARPTKKTVTDLSWVVKKTSKVAFFQQKLRKMRWNSKQREQQQREDSSQKRTYEGQGNAVQEENGESDSAETAGCMQRTKQQDEQGQNEACLTTSSGGDVFINPTLIGDAIEIFLRSTMQQNSGSVGPGDNGRAGSGDRDRDEHADVDAVVGVASKGAADDKGALEIS